MFASHLARAWALTALIVLPSYAQSPSDVEEIAFFEKHVRPLLLEHCFECHGEKKQEGGLRIDRPSSILLGGDSGNTVVPRKPEESLLWVAVAGKHPDLRMPPAPAKELTPKQIGILGQWIRHGAKIPTNEASPPGVAATAESIGKKGIDRSHWSFHSPTLPSLPRVKDQGWPRTSIDAFILAKLESSGLSPSPDTDRSTWLRRVTFDLIGLPPSVQEQIDFEQDGSLEAFDRVVDRLLASPEYGRRWGRHWLDVARYADSNGLDENIAHGNAWRYRNYAIDAMNRDKPYDRFLTEQLAGDLLPYDSIEQRHEQLVATGFLSLGPKVLAEVDEKKMEMDIVDEQIDTIGKAILGLTLGCARCHDHKFDPVSMEDYYGLAGVFKSTKPWIALPRSQSGTRTPSRIRRTNRD